MRALHQKHRPVLNNMRLVENRQTKALLPTAEAMQARGCDPGQPPYQNTAGFFLLLKEQTASQPVSFQEGLQVP